MFAAFQDRRTRKSISVKTGLSGVSEEGAQKNVAAEIPGWDFDKVRRAAHACVERELSRITVETETPRHKTIFYTALYHLLCAPTLFDDVDGQYRGMDGKIHQLPAGAHNYSTFSLWDTYRAAHPMYTLFLTRPRSRLRQLPDPHGAGKPRRRANLAAARQRDRLHDRLPLELGLSRKPA